MSITVAEIRPKILSTCTTDAERDLIETLLHRRYPPDHVWIPYVAFALDPDVSPDSVATAAASFMAAELAALLLDDLIDDDLGAEDGGTTEGGGTTGDAKEYALGIAIATTIAVKLVADNPALTRLVTGYMADAFENQLRQYRGVTAVNADYWAEARARVLPYYTYPYMMGAVVAQRNDLTDEMRELGAAFSHVSIIHDDLQDLFEEADWISQQNLVIQYALKKTAEVDWDAVRQTGALDYACNLWLDAVLNFDDLWRRSSVAHGTEIAAHWHNYLNSALPGLVYLSADVDPEKLAAVKGRIP